MIVHLHFTVILELTFFCQTKLVFCWPISMTAFENQDCAYKNSSTLSLRLKSFCSIWLVRFWASSMWLVDMKFLFKLACHMHWSSKSDKSILYFCSNWQIGCLRKISIPCTRRFISNARPFLPVIVWNLLMSPIYLSFGSQYMYTVDLPCHSLIQHVCHAFSYKNIGSRLLTVLI